MIEQTYLTREGFEKLKKDLENLQKEKQELSLMIGEAREQGDLRENAGYQYAREKQAEVLRRMHEIEEKLRKVHLIDENNIVKGEIRIGAKVTMQEVGYKDTFSYTMVGQEESDPANGKLSVHSPLGQGLLGHKKGETVAINLPAGEKKFKILEIGA